MLWNRRDRGMIGAFRRWHARWGMETGIRKRPRPRGRQDTGQTRRPFGVSGWEGEPMQWGADTISKRIVVREREAKGVPIASTKGSRARPF